jgi:hypothetical protein
VESRVSSRSPVRSRLAVRSPRDFWAGLIYLVIGLGAIVMARDYGMGTAMKMGPGYFPSVLGGVLILIGGISLIRSFVTAGEPVGRFALKPMALIVGSTLLCGFLIRPAGLVVALPLLALVSAYASVKFRWSTALTLAVGLTAFCVLVFAKGLGIPIPVLGSWFGN